MLSERSHLRAKLPQIVGDPPILGNRVSQPIAMRNYLLWPNFQKEKLAKLHTLFTSVSATQLCHSLCTFSSPFVTVKGITPSQKTKPENPFWINMLNQVTFYVSHYFKDWGHHLCLNLMWRADHGLPPHLPLYKFDTVEMGGGGLNKRFNQSERWHLLPMPGQKFSLI